MTRRFRARFTLLCALFLVIPAVVDAFPTDEHPLDTRRLVTRRYKASSGVPNWMPVTRAAASVVDDPSLARDVAITEHSEDAEERDLVDVFTNTVETVLNDVHEFVGTVIEKSAKLPLKWIPKQSAIGGDNKHFLNLIPTREGYKTKFRMLPSGGEFRLPIKIGNAIVEPLADTGSSDIIIDTDVQQYKPGSGTSIGKKFQQAYAGGEHAKGTIHAETVRIGGISLENQAVGKAESGWLIPETLKPQPEGVLGLGLEDSSSFMYDYHDSKDVVPFVVRAAKANLLKAFAFDMRLSGGYIDFNDGVNLQDAKFVPVSDEEMWMVKGTINGVHIHSGALIDSGTAAMFGPAEEVGKILRAAGADKLLTDPAGNVAAKVDCKAGLPLRFQFGESVITVAGPLSAQPWENGKCISILVGQLGGDGTFTIGQPLFFNSYVVFDTVKRAIAFKPKLPEAQVMKKEE